MEQQEQERLLSRMSERERRSYLRKLERGIVDLPTLNGEDSDFDLSDFDDEEEEEGSDKEGEEENDE